MKNFENDYFLFNTFPIEIITPNFGQSCILIIPIDMNFQNLKNLHIESKNWILRMYSIMLINHANPYICSTTVLHDYVCRTSGVQITVNV